MGKGTVMALHGHNFCVTGYDVNEEVLTSFAACEVDRVDNPAALGLDRGILLVILDETQVEQASFCESCLVSSLSRGSVVVQCDSKSIASAAEAMALGPETVCEVSTYPAGNSWIFENRAPQILKGDYTPFYVVDIFVKDFNIIHTTERELAMPTPVASSALQKFTVTKGAGLGREDDAMVIKVHKLPSGIGLPPPANDAGGA